MATLIDCPNHNGNYDCTPFCSVCEGNQVYQPRQEVITKDQLIAWLWHKCCIAATASDTEQEAGNEWVAQELKGAAEAYYHVEVAINNGLFEKWLQERELQSAQTK